MMAAKKRRLAYAAALPLILVALRVLPPSDPPAGRGETLAAPAARYVVRFLEYLPAEDHREYLEGRLRGAASPPAGAWRWVERRNPAAAFPTDFAVLEIRDAQRDAVLAALRALGRVRDVHADTGYSRGVLSADQPHGRGKRFTAMSFECEEEEDDVCRNTEPVSSQSSNSSGSWRRKLQMQVHFCTHGGNISA
jgi:membrane-bound transcription factor site-1 protease